MPTDDAEALLNTALALHQQGDLSEAVEAYRHVLSGDPANPMAMHYLALAYSQQGNFKLAVELMQSSVELAPDEPTFRVNFGQVLRANDLERAAEQFRHAIRLAPDMAAAHNGMGVCLTRVGKLDEAIDCFQRAIALQPDAAGSYTNLGAALKERGNVRDAIDVLRRSIELNPRDPAAYNNLANALIEQGRLDEAMAALHEALRFRPDYADAHANLANALLEKRAYDDAISEYRRALSIDPQLAEAHNNLANCQVTQGFVAEAIASYRRSIELKPNAAAHSNLLLTLHYDPAQTADRIYQEHLNWARRYVPPAQERIFANPPDPDRRFRIGYVSPDFRHHPLCAFLEPLLMQHDHARYEIVCYSDVTRPDDVTARLRLLADRWHNIAGKSDAQLAEQIAADEIDILIDLAGHTDRNRMQTFALKPAPVQVTYLGYCNTTALPAMDFRLTDAWLDPPGETDRFHVEKLIRLPETLWCYHAWTHSPVSPLPALRAGYVTFGSLNNLAKITPSCVECWARIMSQLSGSRLILLAAPVASGGRRLRELFGERNIAADRLEFVDRLPYQEYLRLFDRIDISLDPFPYNGQTTTCNSMWMGAPVVALRGQTHVSRAGVSILSNLQMPELIADWVDEYVRIAIQLASDLPALARMRDELRDRMRGSAIMNAAGFAANVEQAYRTMWRTWCQAH